MLDIHPQAEDRIRQVLLESIPHIKVDRGVFIHFESVIKLRSLDGIISRGSEAWEILTSIISDHPVSEFVKDQLERRLRDVQEFYNDGELVPLLSCEGMGDAESISDQLISELKSLPWVYSFFIKLPREIASPSLEALNSEVFDLCESTSLISAQKNLNDRFPNPGSFNNFRSLASLIEKEENWPESGLFLRHVAEGYVLRSETDRTSETVSKWFRATGGLALATDLVEKEYEYFANQPEVKVAVFRRKNGNNWDYVQTNTLPFDASSCLLSLSLARWVFNINKVETRRFIRFGWDTVGKGLELAQRDERFLHAAHWFFDSHSSQSKFMSFVQATVVMETLLGDKDMSEEVGLSALLRNRCAYLIGKNEEDREQIINDFKRIYKTRSKIVHTGKSSLSQRETSDLYRLRQLCSRVIAKEISMRTARR